MKKYVNGRYVEIPQEEIDTIAASKMPYKDRVVERIRAVYSVDDEIAILRQRDTKPYEFLEYNRFVEAIKEEEK